MIKSFTGKLKEFIEKYHLNSLKDVAIFMAILLFFHFLFRFFVRDIYAFQFINNSAYWLSQQVYEASTWILEVLNVNVSSFDELSIAGGVKRRVIYYPENNGYVSVNRSCSGLKQFYQWIILMILYPGPWKHKAWFIPLGIVILHIVNIFRIVGMTIVTMQVPQHWDFIHDNVMRPFFYVVMFALWVWWNEKYYLKRKKEKQLETSNQ